MRGTVCLTPEEDLALIQKNMSVHIGRKIAETETHRFLHSVQRDRKRVQIAFILIPGQHIRADGQSLDHERGIFSLDDNAAFIFPCQYR